MWWGRRAVWSVSAPASMTSGESMDFVRFVFPSVCVTVPHTSMKSGGKMNSDFQAKLLVGYNGGDGAVVTSNIDYNFSVKLIFSSVGEPGWSICMFTMLAMAYVTTMSEQLGCNYVGYDNYY